MRRRGRSPRERQTDIAEPVVELRAASKRYGWDGPWVLRDVNLEVPQSTLVKVRGVNGSGKSTLLRLLAGATVPTRGRRVSARSLAVGYSPERLDPPPPFSAAAFLAHHVRLRGCALADGDRRVRALAQRLELTSLLPEPLATLSKGSLQKVVLIQAMLGAPSIVILDEPFTALDLGAQQVLIELLVELTVTGAAVVMSDHRAVDALPLADVSWHVADGSVRQEAATAAGSRVEVVAGLPGVLEHHGDGRSLHVLVEPTASDAVLRRLLELGWHVQSVGADGGTVAIEARRARAE